MTDSVLKTADKLKELIDENGPEYLDNDPYGAFTELKKSGVTDRKTASAILCFLANGMLDNVGSDSDFMELSKQIQKTCGLNKKTSDKITAIFNHLFSRENEEDWEKRNLEGLKNFKKEKFVCSWNGYAYWDEGNGGVVCHYEAEIVLMPTEHIVIDETLIQALTKNPFMKKEAIAEHYRIQLENYLDNDFEEYCTCEHYYQPCVEDFMDNREPVSTWYEDNGFELIECEGYGYDDGYEPKLWSGGW